MIECPKCHLEYRGSIPKFCMECGTKLPSESRECEDIRTNKNEEKAVGIKRSENNELKWMNR